MADFCANWKQMDLGSNEYKSCMIAETTSRNADRSVIKADCDQGMVYLQWSEAPFILPQASRTANADCGAEGFWQERNSSNASEPLRWQTGMQLTSAFKVLCPTNAARWHLAKKRC
jgi:hypothetical protein